MKKRPTKSSKPKPKSNHPRRPRPIFHPASEEMKAWSALLTSELNSWPDITTKPMFGFVSFYRKRTIFVALPQARGFGSPSTFILKFNPMPPALLKCAQGDPRMGTSTRIPGKGWFTFELNSESDLRDALFWLNQAYGAAAKRT